MASNNESSSSSDVDVANLMKKMADMKTRALVDAEKDRQLEQEFARLKAARNQRQQRSVLKGSIDATGKDLLEDIKSAPPSSSKDTPQSLEELEEQFRKKQEARTAERERIRKQGTASAGPKLGGSIPLGLGGGLSAVDLPPDFEKVPMKMHRGNMTPIQKDFANQVAAAALGGKPKSQSMNVPEKKATTLPQRHFEAVHRSSAPATLSEPMKSRSSPKVNPTGMVSSPKPETKSLADNGLSKAGSSISKFPVVSKQIPPLQSKPVSEHASAQDRILKSDAFAPKQTPMQSKPTNEPVSVQDPKIESTPKQIPLQNKPRIESASAHDFKSSPAEFLPKQLPPLRSKPVMDSVSTAKTPKTPESTPRQMPPLRTKPVIDSANSLPTTAATIIPAEVSTNNKPLSPVKKLPLLRSPLEANTDKPTSYMSSYLRTEDKPRPIHGRDASAGTVRATLPWMMASSSNTASITKSAEPAADTTLPTKTTFSTLDNAINSQIGKIVPKAVSQEPKLVSLTEDKSTQFHGVLSAKREPADDKPKPPKQVEIVVTDTVTSVATSIVDPQKEVPKEATEEETVVPEAVVSEPAKQQPSVKGPQRFGKTIPITSMSETWIQTPMKVPDLKPSKREESLTMPTVARNVQRSDSVTSNTSTISSSSARSGMSFASPGSLGSLGSGSFVDSSKRVSTQDKQSVWEKRGGAWVRKAEVKGDSSPKKEEPVAQSTTTASEAEREPVDFASKLGGIMSRGSPMMGPPRYNKPKEHVANAPTPGYGMSRGIALPGMAKRDELNKSTTETEDITAEADKVDGDTEKADIEGTEDGPALSHLTKNRARRAPRR